VSFNGSILAHRQAGRPAPVPVMSAIISSRLRAAGLTRFGTCNGRPSLRRGQRIDGNAAPAAGSTMTLDLTDEEAAALLRELNNLIENDRYPLSPRIRVLRGIRAKLPGAPREPPPARPPTPEERTPGRAPRSGRPRR